MEQTSTTTETPTSTVGDARASLAAADSSSATPETSSAQTPAAAGTPPAETPVVVTSTDPVDDPRSPFIPRARFDEVNTQKGQLADQLKQYEWAKDYRPEDVQSVASWTRAFARDPVSAVLHAIQTIEANPQHAQALRSHFARTLGARRPSEPVAEPEPEPDLQAADGTLVYSAPAQKAWREWNNRQLTAALTKSFEEKLQPLQRVAQTFQQRESATQADHEASNAIAAFASDPDFTPENRTACREVIAADQRLQALADVDPKAALEIAWSRVHRAKVLPQRDQQSQDKVLANLQQRAVAGTTNPGAASTSAPPNMIGNARAALQYAESVVGQT